MTSSLLYCVGPMTVVGAIGAMLGAGLAQRVMTPDLTRELTATGGVLIIALGLVILEIRRIRVGALLPGLLVSVVVTALTPYVVALTRALGR